MAEKVCKLFDGTSPELKLINRY